jgi:predicted ArsR family transcriptional regulator
MNAYDGDMARLGRIGEALGDGTRRSLYRHVVESQVPLSAGEVGDAFGLHRTVARSHLEKLVEMGLLQVGTRRRAQGGRPAKVYFPSKERLEVQLPPRRYEWLARLLVQLLGRLPGEHAEMAVDVGRDFGHNLARAGLVEGVAPTADARLTAGEVVRWLGESGYRARLHEGQTGPPPKVTIDVTNCVYQEVAQLAPGVVCGFDQGMICGLLGVGPGQHRQVHSILSGDDFCRHEITL